jgi:RND family efflux transporter MFP subunit
MKLINRSLLAGMAAVIMTGCTAAAQAASANVTIKTATRGDLIVGLTADGTVALPVTNLNFEVEGSVKTLYVAAGNSVKKGDLLAELDDTDYLLDIETAKNNLAKAQTNYDDAVWQYEYSLKQDKASLDSTLATIKSGFDSSSYLTAISDAEASLEKRQKELVKARAAMESPYDSYSSDRQLEDANATLTAREAELAVAKAGETFDEETYAEQLADAQELVAQRKEELAEAQDNLLSPYDSLSGDRQLADAKATLDTKKKELEAARDAEDSSYDYTSYDRQISDAVAKADSAQSALNNAKAQQPADQNAISKAESEYNSALTSLYRLYEDVDTAMMEADESAVDKIEAAQKAYDAAQLSLSRLEEDIARAKSTAAEDAQEKAEAARQNLADAQKALEKASKGYDAARADHMESQSKSADTAQKSYDAAMLALTRLEQDIARNISTADETAAETLATAEQNSADAQRSLQKAKDSYSKALGDYKTSAAKSEANYQLSLESYEHAKTGSNSVDNAASNLKEAELELKTSENQLEKLKIYSPLDGEIINISKKEGENVSAVTGGGDGMMFGTMGASNSFITICDLSEIYLSADITEGDIIGVEKGQMVKVSIDSIPDSKFTGEVQTVSSLPSTDSSGITTYATTIKLDQADTTIKDGMAALLTFVRLEHPDVIMIPNKAVFIEENRQYVNVMTAEGVYEKRAVTCGLTNGTETEVLTGLEDGEQVAVGAIS